MISPGATNRSLIDIVLTIFTREHNLIICLLNKSYAIVIVVVDFVVDIKNSLCTKTPRFSLRTAIVIVLVKSATSRLPPPNALLRRAQVSVDAQRLLHNGDN